MSSIKSLKRKASSSKLASKKRIPVQQPSPSPSDLDEDFEDLEDGSGADDVEQAGGIYDDPMIDRRGSDDDSDDSEQDEDEDEEDEDEDDGSTSKAGPSRSTISSGKHLYKAPTLEEMETLKAVEQSGGTTFSLQLSALLESTLLPLTPQANLKALLSTLHSTILSLPSLPPLPPTKAIKRLGKEVKVPFVGGPQWDPIKNEVKWQLGWDKPEEIIVGGSWGVVGGYRQGKGEAGNIDLVVVMPSTMFSPKDRMDYRYFHKRSHYLAVTYAAIQKLAKEDGPLRGVQVSWETAMGDARRPIVKISAGKEQGLKHHLDIRIHASILPTVFPISTLSPTKSLLRSEQPTPLYSSSMINDTLHRPHLLHLHKLSQLLLPARTVDSFLAIWRIWCTRRGIRRERGASAWFASMLLGWVVGGGEVGGVGGVREKVKKVRGVGKGLGHWGAIRAAWEFLAHTDFTQTPIFINTSSDDTIAHAEFTKSFDHDVFVDPTGRVNIFAGWERGDAQILRHHARETLAMLEDENTDQFGETFLKDRKVGTEVFDEFIRVDISSAQFENDLHRSSDFPSSIDLPIHLLADILRRGLSDRAQIVHISPSLASPSTLEIGVIFNPEHANRVIDIGPSSDSSQAAAAEVFRALWGSKAELRRFKDGSISESVVWDITRPEEATLIPGKIVKYLLGQHFQIPEENVRCLSSYSTWQDIVQVPASVRNAINISGSEKQGFRPVLSAYEELYKILKDLDTELPLSILNVNPSSELLRYSSIYVPHPIDINRITTAPVCITHIPPVDVVVQFESSPKWPDDLAAIQNVKLALFEKLARVLQGKLPKSQINILFDSVRRDSSEIEDSSSLEVLMNQGIAFRLKIHYEKERVLLERIIQEDRKPLAALAGTQLPKPSIKLAIPALEKHVSLFNHKTQHHQSVIPLHHKFPSYSTATRLLKKWFSSHMLLGIHVSIEVVELIMAQLYLDTNSLQRPSSATNGFVRAMCLLAEWDWKNDPLFVPIFSVKNTAATDAGGRIKFPVEKRREAVKAFKVLRSKDSSSSTSHQHGWVVYTEEDDSGLRWTKGVNKVIASRTSQLAKATLTAIKIGAMDGGLDVKSLFITPLDHYDFLLHLLPSTTTKYYQNIQANSEEWESKLKYRNLHSTSSDGAGVKIGFNPVESFVQDLIRTYGDSILWFYDCSGGAVIAGIWNPQKDSARALKAFLGYNSKPTESDSALVTINKDAILAEIARLGKEMIESVDRRN
ncbi:hypothetical protein V865_001449 [Kwoniella europaea PYCC6329]|uniref:U3 small nucleolar RNA-associated protein 22 n=1 Tax=Kwoniella europaea PYCC6329 TaxID=1423913 RepID=A0AAX4KCD5_9TREE